MDAPIQDLTLTGGPLGFFGLVQFSSDLRIGGQSEAHLECNKETLAVKTKSQTVIPIGCQTAWKTMGSGPLEVEFQCAPQMTHYCGSSLVSVRDHLLVEVKIAGFVDQGGNSIEKPEAVV